MTKYTNNAAGARGINLVDPKGNATGETVWVDPGQTVEVDDSTIDPKKVLPDFAKGGAAAKAAAQAAAEPAPSDQPGA